MPCDVASEDSVESWTLTATLLQTAPMLDRNQAVVTTRTT
jgi:hypothetical protein